MLVNTDVEKLCFEHMNSTSPHPALLRYHWHITLYKFKVYNVLISSVDILQNDHHHSVS